ncbi:MAG: hypothetical protein OCC49_16500 [Fibrobacterales bacterium]
MARRGRRPKGLDDDFEDFKINIDEEGEDGTLSNGLDDEDEEIDLESRKPFADDMFEHFDEDDY